MCGWVGVFGAPESESALRKAADTLASRGPDGAGERVVGGPPLAIGLAHRRLAVLDPSAAGAQPMVDASRGVSVVYNGEIYNSPDLRRRLEAGGATFRSGTDTEVLLVGWAEWGDDILRRIEGIFSFALVDERRGRVLLARDRLGVKPLYWAETGGTLVAGSAPRAILSLRPDLRAGLDPVAVAQFLTLLWVPHPRTPWAGVHKLAPGCALSFERGATRQWRYWSPPEPGHAALDGTALRRRLEEATARQLLSDVPVGLLLSGGLDSTLLLAFMARHYRGRQLHALTAGYDAASQRLEIDPDDTAYARAAAAEHPRVALTTVELGGDPGGDLDELSFHFDDPVADPAAVTLRRLVRASETKVLLSGVGGEELFAGYPRHLALPAARAAARLPATARR
ncbi:MAG: asparagine synthase (glutamine-hydrolyzing), partial [Acidimicrobiales bacterium]